MYRCTYYNAKQLPRNSKNRLRGSNPFVRRGVLQQQSRPEQAVEGALPLRLLGRLVEFALFLALGRRTIFPLSLSSLASSDSKVFSVT